MHMGLDLPPTHVLTKAAATCACLAVGFALGSSSAWTLNHSSTAEKGTEENEEAGNSEEDEHDEISDGDLSVVKAKPFEQCKLVLVVRTDLKMEAGDISTQCSAATLSCYKALSKKNPSLINHWERTGQAKIALKGKSEEQLLELEAIAKSLNLCARAVHSEELTSGTEGTRTVLGIGPAPVDLVNQVTGKLRLF